MWTTFPCASSRAVRTHQSTSSSTVSSPRPLVLQCASCPCATPISATSGTASHAPCLRARRRRGEQVSEAITEFKGCFPSGSVPKGKELLLVRSPDGRIFVEYEGRVLGGTKEPWVGRNMIASYFSKNPISEKLLEDVAKGLECHGNVKNVVLDHEKKRKEAGQ
jgi:hypothetical protein